MSSTIWMVRAGSGGYCIDDFLKGYIGVGWNELGDLSDAVTRDAIRARYNATYPDDSKSRASNAIAMNHKFRNVLAKGTPVLTYDTENRVYHLGEITSDYMFKDGVVQGCSHIREVTWEKEIDRDRLSGSSRNTLGSTLTLFALNEEVAQEILDWRGNVEVPQSVDDEDADESDDSDFLRDDTVSRARELIKDRMLQLDDGDLELLVAALLNAMGYKAAVTPQGPDRGVDVFASPDGLGLETPRIKAEVKHRKGTRMGAQDIRSFAGGLREGDRGLYVSTGGFTKEAKYEAERATIPIKLLDLDELVSKVVAHYEEFDLDGRALIPLVRIYWPAR